MSKEQINDSVKFSTSNGSEIKEMNIDDITDRLWIGDNVVIKYKSWTNTITYDLGIASNWEVDIIEGEVVDKREDGVQIKYEDNHGRELKQRIANHLITEIVFVSHEYIK